MYQLNTLQVHATRSAACDSNITAGNVTVTKGGSATNDVEPQTATQDIVLSIHEGQTVSMFSTATSGSCHFVVTNANGASGTNAHSCGELGGWIMRLMPIQIDFGSGSNPNSTSNSDSGAVPARFTG